jgi:hexulose-6-phosphate isomerase
MKKGIVFGTVRSALPDGTLLSRMELAARCGFDGVELQHGADRDFAETASKDELRRIRDAAAEAGVEIPSIMPAAQPVAGPDAQERSKARDVIVRVAECAGELGAETVLIVPGRVEANHPYGELYRLTVEAMRDLSGRVPEGVTLAIENVWNKFLYSPIEFAHIIDEIDRPNVKAYFDVGNVMAFGFPQHYIRELGKRIDKVHVKDYRVQHAGAAGFCNLLEGDVDFAEVVSALRDVGYDGYVTAEVGGYVRARALGVKAIADALDAMVRGRL